MSRLSNLVSVSVTTVALLMAAPVFAKVPAPVLDDAAKAKAAEAAAKTAWAGKVDNFKLCKSMERVAGHYFKTVGKDSKPPAESPACTDPGPFVYGPAPAAPAAGAAPTAAAPSTPAAPAAPATAPAAKKS